MRWVPVLICCGLMMVAVPAIAKAKKTLPTAPAATTAAAPAAGEIEVTADESLEWYQGKHLYVARGNAKAVRGTMTVEADILTAHERKKPAEGAPAPTPSEADKDKTPSQPSQQGGNIDQLTAEGHVHITDPRQQVFGDRAVYDFDKKVAVVTGDNLKYVTEKDVVTAKDSLEYYEDKNMAVARGNAKALHDKRHVEGDVLTAHFTQTPAGQTEMSDMTAEGHVTVITDNDVSRGDHAVYDVKRNAAVLTGHVRVTRGETQLSGDRAEVDFSKGESRLMNQGSGRVRALLVPKPVNETAAKTGAKAPVLGKVDTGANIGQKVDPKAVNP